MIRHRRAARAAALVLGAAVVGVFGLASAASAHVTVNPREATQGGYGRVAFRVPNESDTASTIKLEVAFPEDAPLASVSTMPVPGWTVAIEKRKVNPPVEVHGSQVGEVVSKITWTAPANAGVKPGEFQEFPVSMGPLPEVKQIVFRVLQHYSDGETSRWIEPPAADGTEPENDPAPVLKLLPAADGGDAPSTAGPAVVQQPAASASEEDEGNSAALGVAIAGLVAGLAGLALGGLAFARTRRETAPPAA
ncbi:YcnI family copper-binding membrane protein [Plantactinospora endophytica]|uniref:Membrane protein n=1 Tax=Plantactinospora endophytica TaxID=673535 RepID=A0ABQ4DUU4_9ACTN|nr:YcnI family protein [Plantactinospora endophytica]GIG86229.1 membrane protein [Plantactinospora endophytica]